MSPSVSSRPRAHCWSSAARSCCKRGTAGAERPSRTRKPTIKGPWPFRATAAIRRRVPFFSLIVCGDFIIECGDDRHLLILSIIDSPRHVIRAIVDLMRKMLATDASGMSRAPSMVQMEFPSPSRPDSPAEQVLPPLLVLQAIFLGECSSPPPNQTNEHHNRPPSRATAAPMPTNRTHRTRQKMVDRPRWKLHPLLKRSPLAELLPAKRTPSHLYPPHRDRF